MKEVTRIQFALPGTGGPLRIETGEGPAVVLAILRALQKGGARFTQVSIISTREAMEDATALYMARLAQAEVL
jgi:hypothetical protein